MRTVTKGSGLVLSETVPDSLSFVWENAYPDEVTSAAAKRTNNKTFLIAFVLLMVVTIGV